MKTYTTKELLDYLKKYQENIQEFFEETDEVRNTGLWLTYRAQLVLLDSFISRVSLEERLNNYEEKK